MILHTILPRELIFQFSAESAQRERTFLYNGIYVLAEQVDGNRWRIRQIISTDPNDYLDPNCVPGKIISLFPQDFNAQ